MRLRPAAELPTPAFRVAVPLLLIALLALWDAIVISEKSWLYALVVGAVGLLGMPLALRTRTVRGLAAVTLALLVAAHFVAFLVWSAFVVWE